MSRAPSDRAAMWVVACFGISTVAAAGVVVVLWRHGSVQAAGLLLALALGALSVGLATWASRLTPEGPFDEQRRGEGDEEDREVAETALTAGAKLPRRGLVVTTLAGAVATLGGALAVPLSSLGPRPGRALLQTGWQRNRRAVGIDGRSILAADIPEGGIVTAFPQGDEGSADGQVILVRVDRRLLDLPEGRSEWSVDGLVGYSKVCTHAGCPVGLFSAETNELLCPCHQSSFDVLRGAVPTHGPAAWPLPQLPLRVDGEGAVVAAGPLSDPVGPGWWRR